MYAKSYIFMREDQKNSELLCSKLIWIDSIVNYLTHSMGLLIGHYLADACFRIAHYKSHYR